LNYNQDWQYVKTNLKLDIFFYIFKFPEQMGGTGVKRYHYFPKNSSSELFLAINCSYDVIILTFINLSCSQIGIHLKAKLKMSKLDLLLIEWDQIKLKPRCFPNIQNGI
jgi:hypothetical protein